MGRSITLGNPPIVVDIKQSARARRLSLRVSRLDGKVGLTMPKGATERQAMDFLVEREEWLRRHIEDVAAPIVPKIGEEIKFRGQPTPIVASDLKRATFRDGALLVPQDDRVTATKLKAFLKLAARDALAEASDRYAAQVGRTYQRLSLRDTRSRWGSCSSKGVLMYSWRLILAPPAVLDYVAAHEVSHLVHMDHSSSFWSTVRGLMPDYEVYRKWLRQNGSELHRLTFPD